VLFQHDLGGINLGLNENIPTSHQFVGQFRELAAPRWREAQHSEKPLDC
jgi:hypothetical protein